jgi:uncharacterized protein YdaU (DUF1376 family)
VTSDEKVDAWMPLWIGSYLADTMKLTTLQHGAYLLLLIAYWRERGPLVDDDEELSSTIKASAKEWKTLRPKLERFFTIEAGVWRHGRADQELAKALQHKTAATAKAKAGADARWKKGNRDAPSIAHGNAPSIDEALLRQSPTPTPTPIGSVAIATAAGAAPGSDDDPSGMPPAPNPKPKTAEEMAKAELWRAAVSVLEQGGCPASQCRTFMGKMVSDYGFDAVKEAVAAAVTTQPADAREYLRATCMRKKGERRDPVTVPDNPQVAETRSRLDAEAKRKIATPEEIAAIRAVRKAGATS